MPVNTNVKKCGRCLVLLPISKFEQKRNGEYKKYCERCLTLKNQYNKQYKHKIKVFRVHKTPLRSVERIGGKMVKTPYGRPDAKGVNFNLDNLTPTGLNREPRSGSINEARFNKKEPATDVYISKGIMKPKLQDDLKDDKIYNIQDYNKTKKVFNEFEKIREDCGHFCPKGIVCLKCRALKLQNQIMNYKPEKWEKAPPSIFNDDNDKKQDKSKKVDDDDDDDDEEDENVEEYYKNRGLDEDGFNEEERNEIYESVDKAKHLFKDVIKRLETVE